MENEKFGANKSITFRREIIEPVLQAVMEGESCSLVGVGSSGKSNVARQLMREDVRARWLGSAADNVAGVLVDCQHLESKTMTAQALQVLMLEAILATTKQTVQLSAVVPVIENLLDRATDATTTPERVRRNLMDAIDQVFHTGLQRLFFLLDDFDHVVERAPEQVLKSLRGLRDNHKGKLTYITLTRRELNFLKRDEAEIQDFYELFTNTLAVSVYREADAEAMADDLIARWQMHRMNAAGKRQAILLSGAHPGLLKAILNAARHDPPVDLSTLDAADQLQHHVDVEPEYKKIWEGLEDWEHDALLAVAQGKPAVADDLIALRAKGLVHHRADGRDDIFTPLFLTFLREQAVVPGATQSSVRLDPARHSAHTHSREVALSIVEFGLLSLIHNRRPNPVPRAALMDAMWVAEAGKSETSGPPDARLKAYLASLAQKLNSAQQHIVVEPNGTCRFKEA